MILTIQCNAMTYFSVGLSGWLINCPHPSLSGCDSWGHFSTNLQLHWEFSGPILTKISNKFSAQRRINLFDPPICLIYVSISDNRTSLSRAESWRPGRVSSLRLSLPRAERRNPTWLTLSSARLTASSRSRRPPPRFSLSSLLLSVSLMTGVSPSS